MSKEYRINVPAPDGRWLTVHNARRDDELYDAWIESAVNSAIASRVPTFRRVQIRAEVRACNRRVVQVANDVRPSLDAVITGLVAAEVIKRSECVVGRTLSLGVSTGDLEPLLVLKMTEVG